MKINIKLGLIVFCAIFLSVLLAFNLSGKFFSVLLLEKQSSEYMKSRKILENFLQFQKEKMELVARAISNDNIFLHSALLSNELGYVERPKNILSDYIKRTGLSFFIYLNTSHSQYLTNLNPKPALFEIISACRSNSFNMLKNSVPALLQCQPLVYLGKNIGLVIVGYKLSSDFENLLSGTTAKKVTITNHIDEQPKDPSMTYYNYNLNQFNPLFEGKVVLSEKGDPSISSDNLISLKKALLFNGILMVGIMLILAVIFWALISRRLQKTNHFITNRLKNMSIPSQHKKVGNDEITVIQTVIVDLFDRLEEYYLEKQRISELKSQAEIGKTALQVAHDICSPLSSMQAALGYLGDFKISNPKFHDVMNLLHLSSKRLTEIANGLLEKRHGESRAKKKLFSIHHVLDELLGEYIGQKEYTNVHFVKNYHSEAIYLLGDKTRLGRAFGNVVKNAVEVMKNRGTLIIQTKISDPNIEIHIKDTGPGISEETLQKVLRGGHSEKSGGHGIGLTVVQEVVKEHGGELDIKSELGRGTEFIFKLLIAQSKMIVEETIEEENPRSMTLEFIANEPVVVIEDEPSMREQWRILLRDLGYEALLFENYESFKKMRMNDVNHNAIVDYEFKNSQWDGIEVVKQLKQKGFSNICLCTAEYWKPSVQKLVQELDITLCPKPLPKIKVRGPVLSGVEGCVSAYVRKSEKENALRTPNGSYKVLVIDDDPLIGVTWRAFRERMNIGQLYFYRNLESLIENQEKENLDLGLLDFVFLDKNIEQTKYNVKEAANYLKSNKVKKLILATGDDVDAREFFGIDHVTKRKVPPTLEAFL